MCSPTNSLAFDGPEHNASCALTESFPLTLLMMRDCVDEQGKR